MFDSGKNCRDVKEIEKFSGFIFESIICQSSEIGAVRFWTASKISIE